MKPEVIFALPGINPELMASLIENLKSERGYIHLDMNSIIKFAKKRNTEMGKRYSKGEEDLVCLNIEQLKKILYQNPNNKKFVITNFSNKLEDFKKFECEVCEISKLVTFAKTLDQPVLNKFYPNYERCD